MNQQPPIPPPSGEIFRPSNSAGIELREIASAQKLLLWAIVATLPVFLIPYLILPAWAFQIWAVYNMSKTLKLPNIWLWVIGTMIPLIGLFVLLRMNAKATSTLQIAGVRVGLMGATMNDLNK
jgi:hypothetical protein